MMHCRNFISGLLFLSLMLLMMATKEVSAAPHQLEDRRSPETESGKRSLSFYFVNTLILQQNANLKQLTWLPFLSQWYLDFFRNQSTHLRPGLNRLHISQIRLHCWGMHAFQLHRGQPRHCQQLLLEESWEQDVSIHWACGQTQWAGPQRTDQRVWKALVDMVESAPVCLTAWGVVEEGENCA